MIESRRRRMPGMAPGGILQGSHIGCLAARDRGGLLAGLYVDEPDVRDAPHSHLGRKAGSGRRATTAGPRGATPPSLRSWRAWVPSGRISQTALLGAVPPRW